MRKSIEKVRDIMKNESGGSGLCCDIRQHLTKILINIFN